MVCSIAYSLACTKLSIQFLLSIYKVCWYLFDVILFLILWTFKSADNFPLIAHEQKNRSFCTFFPFSLFILFSLLFASLSYFSPLKLSWLQPLFYELFLWVILLRSCIAVYLSSIVFSFVQSVSLCVCLPSLFSSINRYRLWIQNISRVQEKVETFYCGLCSGLAVPSLKNS